MKKLLKPNGKALVKVMKGPSLDEVIDAYLVQFEGVVKVKPSASRSESNETYLLATGYQQSQHQYSRKVKEIKREVASVKTEDDLREFEESVNEEGKQIAESILKDMRKTGQDITPGTKQALMDLGLSEDDINEPALNKKNFLDKQNKSNEFEADLDKRFREKFGIADDFNLKQYREELMETSKNIRGKADNLPKIKYKNEEDYEYPNDERYITINFINLSSNISLIIFGIAKTVLNILMSPMIVMSFIFTNLFIDFIYRYKVQNERNGRERSNINK